MYKLVTHPEITNEENKKVHFYWDWVKYLKKEGSFERNVQFVSNQSGLHLASL